MPDINKEKLINSIISSSGGKLDKQSLENAARGDMGGVMSGLGEDDKRKLMEALSDKEKTRQKRVKIMSRRGKEQ